MKQVKDDGKWYLMDPDECPGLDEVYGDEYEKLYWEYVEKKKYKTEMSAQTLFRKILDAQMETGTPYMVYKDNVNRKNNQKNLGTIKNSNLCAEICEFSSSKEHAVCNLASIALNRCLEYKDLTDQVNNFVVYTKPDCNYCKYTKNYLSNLVEKHPDWNIQALFHDVSKEKLQEVVSSHRSRANLTYPQIFYNDKLIGGFEDLIKFMIPKYNYKKLYQIAYQLVVNLDKTIDISFYPTKEARFSNLRHRPIGLGVQGLIDTLFQLRIPFDSEEALELNKKIFATIYYGALKASNDLAINREEKAAEFIKLYHQKEEIKEIPVVYQNDFVLKDDQLNQLYHQVKPNRQDLTRTSHHGAYSSFIGSLFSEGKLQYDMWDNTKISGPEVIEYEDFKTNWSELKELIVKHGTKNSMLTALMPTASTSQILGNNECFEPMTNNIYTRRTLAGNFTLVNKFLVNDLLSIGRWNEEVKQMILAHNGSIQSISDLPTLFKNLYKMVWEIKQIWVLKASLERSPYIDQTQSLNVFMATPSYRKLFSCHFWGWKNGLKTGLYYLRSQPSTNATKFTVDPRLEEECVNCSA